MEWANLDEVLPNEITKFDQARLSTFFHRKFGTGQPKAESRGAPPNPISASVKLLRKKSR